MLPTGIPRGLTHLIGRVSEIDSIRLLLRDTRLLTLTGAGGSGKTRLASEIAIQSAGEFRDGAAWIELAPLNDGELLPTHMLAALGQEQGNRKPLDALLDALRPRHLLLVLDNCEHLVESCAVLAERLLRECPDLRILATSREALGVDGERAWLVPGLSLPSGANQSVEDLSQIPAVRLFVERAQSTLASFRLTPANAAAVTQICRRLDGMPLAIELAAARVGTLPPEELAHRLDDAFRVLTSGPRSVPRHRTLREAIEWSYRLLTDRERALLQRLSIFAGDFTLNAAESVGADVDLDAADVLDTLAGLVDKSLVVMREEEGSARFQLLETIRQFGSARLKDSGNFHRVCMRHARTYLQLAEEAAPFLIRKERPGWVRRIHRELDNIRVALACTRDDNVAGHLRFLGYLSWFWYSSGYWSEGRKWLEAAIALPAPADARHDRARVLLGAGVLASLQGDTASAVRWVEESAATFRALGDESGEAYSLAYQGVSWGLIADERCELPTLQALAWFRKSGDLYGLRLGLVVLSTYYAMTGRVQEARILGEEAVEVARSYGLDRELAIALQILAGVRLVMGDIGGAEALYRECIGALLRDPSLFWTARALHMMALVSFRQGDAGRGAYLLGASEVVRDMVGARLFGHDRAQLEPAIAAARQTMGEEAFAEAGKAGRAVPLTQLLEELARTSPARSNRIVPLAGKSVPLEVWALGPLKILRDGELLPDGAWRYAKPRELFLYLMAHPQGRTREQVGLVFWPDASPTQVKNNFHVMLHHVRKALGRADLITFEKDRYRITWDLEGGVRFDARSFEEIVTPALRELRSGKGAGKEDQAVGRLSEGLSLYRGEFLADANAGDWHLEIRDHLRRLFCDATIALGDLSLARGSFKDAAERYGNAVKADDLNEAAHRKLLIALARGGERNEALRHFERLAHTLRVGLGAEPERETRVLVDRLRKAETV